MSALVKIIFTLWVLSIPFYSYSIVGTLSLDNLLAPITVVILLYRELTSGSMNKQRIGSMMLVFGIFSIYSLSRMLSVVGQEVYLFHTVTLLAKQFIYLLVPVLFLRRIGDWMYLSRLIVIISAIGIFSSLVASLGLYEFQMQRFAAARFGFEGLQKSIGLFANYGDMAMLGSFSFLVLFGLSRKDGFQLSVIWKWMVAVLILAGYLGAQSRNMFLTLGVALVAAKFFSLLATNTSKSRATASMIAVLAVTLSIGMILLSDFNFLESAREIGGTSEASATIDARLGQYAFAYALFAQNPWFGDGATVLKAGVEIHNIWFAQLALGGLFATSAVLALFVFPFLKLMRFKSKNNTLIRLKVIGLSQLVCIFVASEFYGGMSYIFLLCMATIFMLPALLSIERRRLRIRIDQAVHSEISTT